MSVNRRSSQNKRQQESQRRNADVIQAEKSEPAGRNTLEGRGQQQQHGTAPMDPPTCSGESGWALEALTDAAAAAAIDHAKLKQILPKAVLIKVVDVVVATGLCPGEPTEAW